MNDKKSIYLFDDNPQELRTYKTRLEKSLPIKARKELSVVAQLPFKDKSEYINLINSVFTACLIFDQRLKVSGKVNYTGIEIATELRALNTKIPIYILTNFGNEPGEFGSDEWAVEDVISKGHLGDPNKSKKLVARLLRHIDTYQDLLAGREQRFHDLLIKNVQGKLSNAEKTELKELELIRNLGSRVFEMPAVEKMEQAIQDMKKIQKQLNRGKK